MQKQHYLGVSIALGAGIGTAFGAAVDQIGIAIGVAIGTAISQSKIDDDNSAENLKHNNFLFSNFFIKF